MFGIHLINNPLTKLKMSNADLPCKRIRQLSHLSYFERLSILELEPLELRRLRFDLVQYFKIFHNLSSITPVDYFNIRQPSLTSHAPVPFLVKPLNKPYYVLSSFFIDL